jgi:hypothetical protein
MADGLLMLMRGEDTLDAEAALHNVADLVLFAHAWIEARSRNA